jgi:hypothetical protein
MALLSVAAPGELPDEPADGEAPAVPVANAPAEDPADADALVAGRG